MRRRESWRHYVQLHKIDEVEKDADGRGIHR